MVVAMLDAFLAACVPLAGLFDAAIGRGSAQSVLSPVDLPLFFGWQRLVLWPLPQLLSVTWVKLAPDGLRFF